MKTEKIAEELERELMSWKYPRGSHFPSEYELGERFGVSIITANKAVSMLVLKGYLSRGKRGAGTTVRAVRGFPTRQIGFVGSAASFSYDIINGISVAATENNCYLVLLNPGRFELLPELLEKINGSSLCGIITVGMGRIPCENRPVLYLNDESCGEKNPDFVTDDGYGAGCAMMRELLKRGHREIAVVHYRLDNISFCGGMFDTLREAGFPDVGERSFLLESYDNPYAADLILAKMLKRFPKLTAVAGGNDFIISNICQAFEKRGIDWRGKIAMTGFGNIQSIYKGFPIASVSTYPILLGREAFYHLMQMVETPGLRVREYLETSPVNLSNIPILPIQSERIG